MEWLQQNINKTLQVLEHGISDHVILCLTGEENMKRCYAGFKFINDVIDMAGYNEEVSKS